MSFGYNHHHLSYFAPQERSALSLKSLAERFGTPLYVYDIDDVLRRVRLLKSCFSNPLEIHYAMKANAHPFLLSALAKEGIGVDVVSAGELKWALQHGHKASHCVFSGVGKTKAEIRYALESGIQQLNVESPEELQRIACIAKDLKQRAPVAFRMNPDVNAVTHPYIQTGFRENKFGMDFTFVTELKEILGKNRGSLDLKGLTLHIGSQIRDLGVFSEAILKTKKIFKDFQESGFELKSFDVGGGLGINYQEFASENEDQALQDYGHLVQKCFEDLPGIRILTEPGRILVGRMGMLLTEVQYVKTTPFKKFCIVNTGMHHLLRPALYQATHRILPLDNSIKADTIYDVVGPICESSDVLGYDRQLPQVKEGDLLAVADVGAYGYTMANNYNMHPIPREVALFEGQIVDSHLYS
ncbi:MAG: diaminopimelate decarboxylase [Bdellovibrionales bacterium]|nr:diaminopimelate decarboxylase [Bdellovibrionales bacterium]